MYNSHRFDNVTVIDRHPTYLFQTRDIYFAGKPVCEEDEQELWEVYGIQGIKPGSTQHINHFGAVTLTVYLSKGKVHKGYVNLIQSRKGGVILVEPHLSDILTTSLRELLLEIEETFAVIMSSNASHLFIPAFHLLYGMEFEMGCSKVIL